MLSFFSNDRIINTNNSFTDLFALLKKYRIENEDMLLDYSVEDMGLVLSHAEAVIVDILQGVQLVGSLAVASSFFNEKQIVHLTRFLSLLSNLVEALYTLQMDVEYSRLAIGS